MKLTELRVNNIETPMGFQIIPISFSWKVEDAENAKFQKSARIQIYKSKEVVFDSGDDEFADSLDYPVNIMLEPRTKYEWSVNVTADNGQAAYAESWFETGKMSEDWTAKWITVLDTEIQPVMRKKFALNQAVQNARLYICGLGLYEVYINSKKVGNEYLSPGYHSYDFHLQVQTYDITEYLQLGQNEIQIWLGNGWFKGRLGFDGGYTNLYGDYCCTIGEMHINYIDNTKLVIETDESWEYKQSPIVFSNIYDGEIYDSRINLYDDRGWKYVNIGKPLKCGELTDRYSLPIVKKESFKPNLIITPKNEILLDFGQNLSGWVEFECEIPKGDKICLSASEIIQDNCFYNKNLRTAKAEFIYISNGQRAYVRPHFTFYGFRYIKVDCNVQINADNFIAYHLRSDFDEIGKIETGNNKVNKLFSNVLWSQKDNFIDVPTDCPQRDERLGWTGDAQIFCETACYNMYMPAFYRKYLWDMRAEQSVLEGSVPNVVPRLKKGMVAEHGSSPWADAGVVIPWNVYMNYGNKTLLRECYSGMKAWIDYERKHEEALGGLHLIKDGFHFADWLALDNEKPEPFGATNPLYIASAYYYYCTNIVANTADILGYKDDSTEYRNLANEILKAIQQTYFDKNGLCICKTQTGSSLAIAFGLMPDKQIQEGAELQKRVIRNNNHLNTGFVGTPIICPALTESGYYNTAVNLLLNEDFPSWLYCVNLGATTVWERWNSVIPDGHLNSDGMNSLNHYSYGSIEAWVYKYVCGIQPTAPGFKKAIIAPHTDIRLKFAECELNTSSGIYKISWKYKSNTEIIYNIQIPFNAEAEFIIDNKKIHLTAGIYQFNNL